MGNFTTGVGFTQEDMIPEIVREVFRTDSQQAGGTAFEITLEQVADSVEREVDGAVREGLNEVLLVEGHFGAQTEGSRTAPLPEPVNGVDEVFV